MKTAAILLVLALAGCQITTFETAPLAAAACDPALSGRWLSLGDDGERDGELELRLGGDCRLEVDDLDKGVLRQGAATTLRVAEYGGEHYAWVDAAWLRERFGPEFEAPKSDTYLMRYRVRGDELCLRALDHVAIAHQIIDGDLPGEVHYADHRLSNRITGPATPAVLARRGVFARDELHFKRNPEAAR